MAEQQFQQEDLPVQDNQSPFPAPFQTGPEPKKQKAVAAKEPATKQPKAETKQVGLPPAPKEGIQFFETPAQQIQKQVAEEKAKEPENLKWLASSFENVRGLDNQYSDFTQKNRMKIDAYRGAFQVKNSEIKRHEKLINNIITATTEDEDIEILTQTDINGNKFINREKLRRIVTDRVKAAGGNGIVGDYVYSKAYVAAEDKFNYNRQKTAFDKRLSESNIPKPKDAAIVEQEFNGISLKARREMKEANESVKMDFISESNLINDKYSVSANEVLQNAPYSSQQSYEDAKTQLLNENIQASEQGVYVLGATTNISDEQIKERAAALFQQRNDDYLKTQYLPIVAQMNDEIKATTKRYNTILDRKKSEIQASYEKQFSNMKAMYSKEDSDYNAAVEKLWKQAEVDVENEYQSKMRGAYKALDFLPGNIGMGATFVNKFTSAAGNMLFGIGTNLRANGIEGNAVDFMTGLGQYATLYNNTYTPSLKDAYLSPRYWSGAVGELLGSSSVIAAATIATQNPYVGALIGNMVEGSSMAGSAYDTQLMKGKDPNEASEAASNVMKMNMLTMPLNALQAKLFMPFTKGSGVVGAFKKTTAGSIGGTVEEVFQRPFEEGDGFKTELLYAPDTLEMGAQVFGTQMLMGGLGGALSTLSNNINKNKKIPAPMAQIGARMARENGPSRIAAVAEALNITGEIDDQQAEVMKLLANDIIRIEQEATSLGFEGDKKDAYVGVAFDIRTLEQQKAQTESESAKSVIDGQISEKKKQLADIVNDRVELASVAVAGTTIVAPIEEVNKIVDTPEFQEAVKNEEADVSTTNTELKNKVDAIKAPPVEAAPAAAPQEAATTPEELQRKKELEDAIAKPDNGKGTVTVGGQLVQRDEAIKELQTLNQKQQYATQVSEGAQQEVAQPSNIVQREGAQEGQPQAREGEGRIGEAAQPAADNRNRDFGSQAQTAIQEIKALPELSPVVQNYTSAINPGQEVQLMDELAQQVTEGEERSVRQMGQAVVDKVKQWIADTGYTAPAMEAPTTEAAPTEVAPAVAPINEVLTLDTKDATNLEKVLTFLDNIDNALKKFGQETAGMNITIPVARAIVNAVKVLVQANMTLQEAIKAVAEKRKVSEQDVFDSMNIMSTIEQRAAGKPTAGVGKILGAIKDIANITKKEKAALKEQVRSYVAGAKDAMSAWTAAKEEILKNIKELEKKGSITAKQVGSIINRFGKVNVLSPKAVSKFVDYMSKVFQDAEYQAKLDDAKDVRKKVSKLSKNDSKNPKLRNLAKQFLEIDPANVENIDAYTAMAKQIEESLKGSKISKTDVAFAAMINIDDAATYIKTEMDRQAEMQRQETADEIQELMGVDVSDFSYEDMLDLLALSKDEFKISKENEAIVRATINKAFSLYSSIIRKTFASGQDQFTGADVEFTDAQKALVNEFMGMDLGRLSPQEAIAAVDALNNFITNKSTAKMGAVVSVYTGDSKAEDIKNQKIKSSKIKSVFSSTVGRFLEDYLVNLGLLFENMFVGAERGRKVKDASGTTDVANGRSKAVAKANEITKNFVQKFYGKKANGQPFNSLFNFVERGMIAFMARNLVGTNAQMQENFNKRKNIIKESIQFLLNGTPKEKEIGKAYQDVYDKLDLENATTANEIISKADPLNEEARKWWVGEWAKIYPELAELAEAYYNKILEKDTDYGLPDRYKMFEDAITEKIDDEKAFVESGFLNNNNTVYQKASGRLQEATRPGELKKNKAGQAQMYINLSFDSANADAMLDALTDLYTARAIKQVSGFLESKSFLSIVPDSGDRKVLDGRIKAYIRAVRNTAPIINDPLSRLVKKMERFTAINVGQALGGLTQAVKQTVGVAFSGFIQTGNLKNLTREMSDFIDRSGYSIASRGVESQAQIESLNKLIEVAASSNVEKLGRAIEKTNAFYLKQGLVRSDAWMARKLWISYYVQSLKKQGFYNTTILKRETQSGNFELLVDGVDWKTHKLNKEAADYAQNMVDRQQNPSDSALQATLFSKDQGGVVNLVRKTMFAFASFRINQWMRLRSDLNTLAKFNVSTLEDKKIALRSLGGFAVEVAAYRAAVTGFSLLWGYLANEIMGDDESEKEFKKRMEAILRGQATGTVLDVLSPLPILDRFVQEKVYNLFDEIQNFSKVAEKDKLNIYKEQGRADDIWASLGTLGIAGQRLDQLIELTDLAVIGGEFEDKYGKKRVLLEKDRNKLSLMILPALASVVGLLPTEVNAIISASFRKAKRRAVVQKQPKATGGGGTRTEGGGGGGGTRKEINR